MNKIKIFLLAFIAFSSAFSAEVKDVSFACSKKSCAVTFQFASAKNLPGYFQKYDANKKTWTVAFASSDFLLGNGVYLVDSASSLLKEVHVFQETGKQGQLLKFEFVTGSKLTNASNPVSLKGSAFTISFEKTKDKSWQISKYIKQKQKEAERIAKQRELELKKATLEAKKQEKAEAIAKKKQETEGKKIALEAKEQSQSKKVQQVKTDFPKKDSVPLVSALLEGISKMKAVVGFGFDRFELKMMMPLAIENVRFIEKKSVVLVSVAGPVKSPVFKVNAPSLVKTVKWNANGLQIQLKPGIRPLMIIKDGSLVLQTKEVKQTKGFSYWNALPTGIQSRRWLLQDTPETNNLDAFVKRYEKDSKKVVSASQTFFLTAKSRELFVVAEEIELYEQPNENSTVIARLSFGDKLESIELQGLYQKVQAGTLVGYVNKRAVSFGDELSAIQAERLKQLAVEKGELPENESLQLSSLNEDDRIMYSSFGRRDPFVDVQGLVEEGINIDQMELVGIIWEAENPVAILSDIKNPSVSYTLREDDKILNGKVLKITQTDVLFLIQEFGVSRRYSMGLPDKFGGQK